MESKGALYFLNQYGGESSDEDVPGPRVSTKRVYRDDSEEETITHKRLPVHAEFTTTTKIENHSDDPLLHQGRIRSFDHERGNWATFVYIPFEAQTGISKLICYMQSIIPDHFGLKKSENFHISLTKTVILKYHWIMSFVEDVKTGLTGFKKFFILFDKVKIYCNEERTRTFVGIQTRSGHDTLLKIVENLDKSLAEFDLPPFYKDPSFHMSIAWAVGDHQQSFETFLPQLNNKLSELMETFAQDNCKLLGGGIESMAITEVFGQFRAGKTQLAHTLCVTAQMPRPNGYMGGKVVFIDTEHTFRPDRLRPIADRFDLDQTSFLENILYARAYNSEHQYELLNYVPAKFHEVPGIFKLLIVDSIMALFRVDFNGRGEIAERQLKLGQMLSRLQKISEEYNVAVFLTNQVTTDFTYTILNAAQVKPIGGNILAHASTTRVALKTGKGCKRIAKIYDSPDLEEKEVNYVITNGGIDDPKDE